MRTFPTLSTSFIQHHDGSLTVNRAQDVEPVLKNAKRLRDMHGGRGKDMYLVGTLPNVIVEKYLKERGISYQEFIRNDEHVMRIMRDPDYKRFRVFEGRV